MGNTTQRTLAVLLIICGAILLAANIFAINLSAIFWPLVLIFAGAFLILRAYRQEEDWGSTFKMIGEIDRSGNWQVVNENISGFVIELDLDFASADFSSEDPQFQILSFVNSIKLRVPEELGVEIQANCFVVETNVNGKKEDFVMSGWRYSNAGSGANTLRLEIRSFVSEIKLVSV